MMVSNEWTFEAIEKAWDTIDSLAKSKYALDYYQPQIEIVSAEQMIDSYSSIGLPSYYSHWSFGKSFIQSQRAYEQGKSHLAYELIINSNPAIAYLMESNSMAMQYLVLCHACVGHSAFFKNNYLFKEWTDSGFIIDYMRYAKRFIAQCEKDYGNQLVETTLDCCHALQNYGVDLYKRRGKLKSNVAQERIDEWKEYFQQMDFNQCNKQAERAKALRAIKELEKDERDLPEENILYFLEKYSLTLAPWQREIIRIVRTIAQYFFPQSQTKILNEGFACWCHHTLMTDLYESGEINEGFYLEALHSHCGVCSQPKWYFRGFYGINPYALGYGLFKDIERIIDSPTDEDREWLPAIAGKSANKIEILKDVVANYRDESAILQFLSPNLVRKMQLMSVIDDESEDYLKVTEVHSVEDVLGIRRKLAAQVSRTHHVPKIEVAENDFKTHHLTLTHTVIDGVLIERETAKQVMECIRFLWGFSVELKYVDENGNSVERA